MTDEKGLNERLDRETAYAATMANTVAQLEIDRKADEARIADLEAKLAVAREALQEIAHPPYGLGFNKLRGKARAALNTIGEDHG